MDNMDKMRASIWRLRGDRVITFEDLKTVAKRAGVSERSREFSDLIDLVNEDHIDSWLAYSNGVIDNPARPGYIYLDSLYSGKYEYLTVTTLKGLAWALD